MANHHFEIGFAQVNLRDVVLPMGLHVDSVKVSADGLRIDTSPAVATAKQPGTFEVFVSEASLSKFVAKKAPTHLRNFQIEARDGKLHVKASVVMILELPATATCSLRIVEQRYLYVDLETVNVMGAGATNLVQAQLAKLNPIVDVDEFPIRAKLERVDIVAGGVMLFGTVAPPGESE